LNLDLFNKLFNGVKKDNKIKSFIKELNEDLILKQEQSVLEQLQGKNNISLASKNGIKKRQKEILINYANKTSSQGVMFFIKSKDIMYNVYKLENGKSSTIQIDESQLPNDIPINSVLREKEGNYVLDERASQIIKNQIIKMINKTVEQQNKKLREYRKEGNLYMVTEHINERIYLQDITDRPNYEIEEVDFPKELINKAIQGTVFKYVNGKYQYYSNDGYETIG